MIVGYDKNPNLSVDQKLKSLSESINLALNEILSEHYSKAEIDRIIEKLEQKINET